MALTPRLDLRQSQSLVMTPQLQQAIKLLALSSLEVEAFVAEAVEKNPLLEIETGEPAERRDDNERTDAEQESRVNTPEDQASDTMMDSGNMAASHALDMDENGVSDGEDAGPAAGGSADDMLSLSGGGAASSSSGEYSDGPDFDSFAAADLTLCDHLLAQAGAIFSGQQLFLVRQLIDQVEHSGYLGTDLPSTAHRLGVELAELESALAALQSLDPTGVGARDLAECIALQAKEADRYDPAMQRLIENLDMVAKGSFDQLRRICHVDEEDLRDMLTELRSYDPKPGSHFGEQSAQAVTPDIFLTERETENGPSWVIELNSANLPKLLVNRDYAAELKSGKDGLGADKATKDWLNDALADAHWLMKAMDQRQRTIIKVASEIVKQQEGFFRSGIAHLRPLTLRQVADAIDMHESTISRVTSNKYLYCDRGLFDLKYFFSSGVGSEDGEGASAEAVKSHIKTLIDGEGDKILSDDKLVVLLRAQGFDLARRTVAKYREAMGIGSSVQRRRARKMGG